MNSQCKCYENKEQFIASHQERWQKTGVNLKASRKQLNLSIKQIALNLNVSATRIGKLEKGKAVSDAKLLVSAYENYIKLEVFKQAVKYNALVLEQLENAY